MDRETKMFLARILGETYRTQRRVDPKMCGKSEATIYGLINGIETAINEEFGINDIDPVGEWIDDAKVDALIEILDETWQDESKQAAFEGYYDIDHKIQAAGISRGDAIRIFRYLKANGQFDPLIDRIAKGRSPSECHNLDLDDWDS